MTEANLDGQPAREPILDVVDRVSELLFGLFMALTFVGAVSVADTGGDQIRAMFAAALGCNLAWGLVDAVMYLVRTITERAKWFTLVHAVRAAADPATGCRLLAGSLSRTAARLLAQAELEAVRRRIVAYRNLPDKPALRRDDLLAAVAIFLIVVASTFPVVLPFVLIGDVGTAMIVSRGIALAMLFLGGLALGHYAGYGHWKAGFIMVGLGTSLVAAIIALGG